MFMNMPRSRMEADGGMRSIRTRMVAEVDAAAWGTNSYQFIVLTLI
jgi:hypothetical protein